MLAANAASTLRMLFAVALLNVRRSHRIGAVARSAVSLDFAVMPAVQLRLVSWLASLLRRKKSHPRLRVIRATPTLRRSPRGRATAPPPAPSTRPPPPSHPLIHTRPHNSRSNTPHTT